MMFVSDRGPEVCRMNEKAVCDPRYLLRNGVLLAFHTLISSQSLLEWNVSKQTQDLMASGWSYDWDRNEGQG